jgi:hypothetical protein
MNSLSHHKDVVFTNSRGIPTEARIFDPSKVRDLRPLALDSNGEIRIMPASFWAETTVNERAMFGALTAAYGFPTIELVEWLKREIGDRRAIEIGAGNGVLAKALGIPATDSYIQADPKLAAEYAAQGQLAVEYGANVERMDAQAAVRKHRPEIVVAQWVTHKFDFRRAAAGGYEKGVDEDWMLSKIRRYLFVGNEKVHQGKAIWRHPHTKHTPDWLYSRAHNGTPNILVDWAGL